VVLDLEGFGICVITSPICVAIAGISLHNLTSAKSLTINIILNNHGHNRNNFIDNNAFIYDCDINEGIYDIDI